MKQNPIVVVDEVIIPLETAFHDPFEHWLKELQFLFLGFHCFCIYKECICSFPKTSQKSQINNKNKLIKFTKKCNFFKNKTLEGKGKKKVKHLNQLEENPIEKNLLLPMIQL